MAVVSICPAHPIEYCKSTPRPSELCPVIAKITIRDTAGASMLSPVPTIMLSPKNVTVPSDSISEYTSPTNPARIIATNGAAGPIAASGP